MSPLKRIIERNKPLFSTPINSWHQWGIIITVALIAIFIVQDPPTDWHLNTAGFDGHLLRIYENANYVYPPWVLVLLWPYYWMGAAASRFASVLVIGWLAKRSGWNLLSFGPAVLNPFFYFAMTKSSLDVLVLVLPLLLWEVVAGNSRWQGIGRAMSISLLLLKPQGGIFLITYLLWRERKKWRDLILPAVIVALIVIPVSLLGSPPLVLQWMENVTNPSPQNVRFWGLNNISLSSTASPFYTVLILGASAFGCWFWSGRNFTWTKNHTFASLLLLSMFLSPYASYQSLSAGIAFIPSWAAVAVMFFALLIFNFFWGFWSQNAWRALLFAIMALILYKPKIGDRPGG